MERALRGAQAEAMTLGLTCLSSLGKKLQPNVESEKNHYLYTRRMTDASLFYATRSIHADTKLRFTN